MPILFTPQSAKVLIEKSFGVPTILRGSETDEAISLMMAASATPVTNNPSAPASL